MKKLDRKHVENLLDYEGNTGLLRWKVSRSNIRAGDIAGSKDRCGYTRIGIDGKRYAAHRLAWLMTYGEFPDGEIDHINGNPSDNWICNLRVVTHHENGRNVKRHKRNKSGVSGVCWDKRDSCWKAYINAPARTSLGYYKDFFSAVCARKSAENRYDYHENHGR